MAAWLGRAHAEQGRYAQAAELVRDVLGHPHLSPITEIVAAAVKAQLDMRSGREDEELLARLRELTRTTGETQRLVPVASAGAEHAWLAGELHRIPAAIERAWSAAVAYPQPWDIGELAWWLAVAGERRTLPVEPAHPYALMLGGEWAAAAEEWHAVGNPLWAALSLARSRRLADARAALEIVDGLGAAAIRAAILRDRHAAGLPTPRGPRSVSRANQWGLTARELEVLGLLAEGLSNAELAARLFLSEKTIGHHVSAILRKSGEPTRSRAVAAAFKNGVIAPN
jgi:DNA-binding CsgD family transcriptional regulator